MPNVDVSATWTTVEYSSDPGGVQVYYVDPMPEDGFVTSLRFWILGAQKSGETVNQTQDTTALAGVYDAPEVNSKLVSQTTEFVVLSPKNQAAGGYYQLHSVSCPAVRREKNKAFRIACMSPQSAGERGFWIETTNRVQTPGTSFGQYNSSGTRNALPATLNPTNYYATQKAKCGYGYVANASPSKGAFTAPLEGSYLGATSVTFTGTTPHNGADGAWDYTSQVQLQVFDKLTDAVVSDTTFAVTTAQQTSKTFSKAVTLPVNKTYYARFRHQDSFGSWSPFSNDRNFSTETPPGDPDPPTPLSPVGLRDAITTPTYSFRHNHPEGRPAQAVEIELRDSTGTTVLWASGTQTINVVSAATGNFTPAAGLNHPALAWATGYRWRARVQDSIGLWSKWTDTALGAFNTNSTPDAPEIVTPLPNAVTGDRQITASVYDRDGDPVTAAQLELTDVATSAIIDLDPGATNYGAMTVTGLTATFTVPAGVMVAGKQYRVRARATDGKASGYGPFSATRTFTFAAAPSVDLLAPGQTRRLNLCTNPSFEQPIGASAYWTPSGEVSGSQITTEQTDDSMFGTSRARLSKKAASGATPLALTGARHAWAGGTATAPRMVVRAYAKKLGTNVTAASLAVECLDDANNVLGTIYPTDSLVMNARDLDPYYRVYGGVIRGAGSTGVGVAAPAGTTGFRLRVSLSGAGATDQDVGLDAVFVEQMPAGVTTSADWTKLRLLFGYADPSLPDYEAGGYLPGGAYGGEIGAWTGAAHLSTSTALAVVESNTGVAFLTSYTHPSGLAKTQDRLFVERQLESGHWQAHHNGAWVNNTTNITPVPDNLLPNQRRYRARVESKDTQGFYDSSDWVEFVTRYAGPPELAFTGYSPDPELGTITLEFESSGLAPEQFGGIEIARESQDGEGLRIVGTIDSQSVTSWTYHYPASRRPYRFYVRQLQIVGPYLVAGRWRLIESSVDYSGWNFLKDPIDPEANAVRFRHPTGSSPNPQREKTNEGFYPWGTTAPVFLFGEGQQRSGETGFRLYPGDDVWAGTPEATMRTLKTMRRLSGALCLLTDLPLPEKTWVALSGPLVMQRNGPLVDVSMNWTQTAYVEDAYRLEGAYEMEDF